MTSNSMMYHYRELTPEGLWVSVPHECPVGARGEQFMRQGVIGGFTSSPRCAVTSTGFFYGLGKNGLEIDQVKALELGLIEKHQLNAGEFFNDRLVKEVRYCGYHQYEAAIKACDVKLTPRPGKVEIEVLMKMKTWDEKMIPDVNRALLFGSAFRGMSKSELAALVKLVRRKLIKVYRTFAQNGYVLRFRIQDEGASS